MTNTATPDKVKVTFSFGKNWEDYLGKCFSEERVRISRDWILRFLEVPDLKGKTFVDVGSGSGLSSLAAFDAGAERVLSFDVDPKSVAATTRARQLRNNPDNWQVLHGSALDPSFLAGLGTWDIVYSWGVLHHTGQMWNAVRNAATLMGKDGVFYTALYTTDSQSGYWTEVKKRYNAAGPFRKRVMEYGYVWRHLFRPNLFAPHRAFRTMREYKASRGMDYLTDVRDWLGGYPYEHARIEEVLQFGRRKLGLELVNLKTGEACTEYLFAASGNKQWALGGSSAQPCEGA